MMKEKGGMLVRRDENWAVALDRIAAFFHEQPDVQAEGDSFRYRSCVISIGAVAGQAMGKWALPRTRLIFEGGEQDVKELHRRFFLRFLSAGG